MKMHQYRMSEVPLKHVQRHFHKSMLPVCGPHGAAPRLQNRWRQRDRSTLLLCVFTSGSIRRRWIFILHHFLQVASTQKHKTNITKIMKVSKSEMNHLLSIIHTHIICQAKESVNLLLESIAHSLQTKSSVLWEEQRTRFCCTTATLEEDAAEGVQVWHIRYGAIAF